MHSRRDVLSTPEDEEELLGLLFGEDELPPPPAVQGAEPCHLAGVHPKNEQAAFHCDLDKHKPSSESDKSGQGGAAEAAAPASAAATQGNKRPRSMDNGGASALWETALELLSSRLAVGSDGNIDWAAADAALEAAGVVVHGGARAVAQSAVRSERSAAQREAWAGIASKARNPDVKRARQDVRRLVLSIVGHSSQALFGKALIKAVAEYFLTVANSDPANDAPELPPLSAWPDAVRRELLGKLVEMHKLPAYGSRLYRIYYHFKSLLAPGEVEMAILRSCHCEGCVQSWSLADVDTDNEEAFRAHFIRETARTHLALLRAHEELHCAADDSISLAIERSGDRSLSKFHNWAPADLVVALSRAHDAPECAICSASQCKRLNRRGTNVPKRLEVSNAFADLALTPPVFLPAPAPDAGAAPPSAANTA